MSVEIILEGARVSRGGRVILDGVDWRLEPGARLALAGGNGAGKSTLLRLARGDIWPDQLPGGRFAGERLYVVDGQASSSPIEARGRIGLAGADLRDLYRRRGFAVSAWLVAASGLTDSPLPVGALGQAQRQAALEALETVGAADLADRSFPELSQGQAMAVLAARALVRRPDWLFLDEAADGLDRQARRRLGETLERLSALGVGLAVTTHHPAALPDLGFSALLLERGRVTASGSLREVSRSMSPGRGRRPGWPGWDGPESGDPEWGDPVWGDQEGVDQKGVGPEGGWPGGGGPEGDGPDRAGPEAGGPEAGGPEVDGPGDMRDKASVPAAGPCSPPGQGDRLALGSPHRAKTAPCGRAGDMPASLREFPASDEPLLLLEGVALEMAGRTVLEGLDWAVLPGRHWAVLGANGAGKSSLLKVLAGELRQTSGRVVRFGLAEPASLWDLRGLMGLVSWEAQTFSPPGTTLRQALVSGYFGSFGLYETPSPVMLDTAAAWLERLGLAGLADQPLETLSQGQARRALIGRAMIFGPRLLLLDEPLGGLDAAARADILDLLDGLAAQGVGLVMVTHHPEELPACIDAALLLEDGRVRACGMPEAVLGQRTQAPVPDSASPTNRRRPPGT